MVYTTIYIISYYLVVDNFSKISDFEQFYYIIDILFWGEIMIPSISIVFSIKKSCILNLIHNIFHIYLLLVENLFKNSRQVKKLFITYIFDQMYFFNIM